MAIAQLVEVVPTKTYKTKGNAIAAVDKLLAQFPNADGLRYFVAVHTDGRFYPVFIGIKAIELGMHFHFNVIG